MANLEIRREISMLGFKYYEVAGEVGITPSLLSLWLRTELREDRRERVSAAIERLKERRRQELLCSEI